MSKSFNELGFGIAFKGAKQVTIIYLYAFKQLEHSREKTIPSIRRQIDQSKRKMQKYQFDIALKGTKQRY